MLNILAPYIMSCKGDSGMGLMNQPTELIYYVYFAEKSKYIW